MGNYNPAVINWLCQLGNGERIREEPEITNSEWNEMLSFAT